ncbi:ferredoxin [Nocardioides sp. J9]|uniref:ferredoxin n=1 Tax=Nocardioides sp. J9 TaxID=935844 RepID=UPI00119FCE78|nr:ferredoxin [Nocardioides sp. J9]TWH01733.1 ferredoxin [Nocardioides sp. J9]
MHIEVDEEKCVGGGQCVMAAAQVFDQDDDGIVILLNQSPSEELHEPAREAAILCPAAAIRITE